MALSVQWEVRPDLDHSCTFSPVIPLYTGIHTHAPVTCTSSCEWKAPDTFSSHALYGWYVWMLFILYHSYPDALPRGVGSDGKLSSVSLLFIGQMKSDTIYSITFNTLPIAIVLPESRQRTMNSQVLQSHPMQTAC
jgi:hypothetical protein